MKIKVHSGDPIKKYVVALIKKKANCAKVKHKFVTHNKIPNQGITELFNQLGLISTKVSQNIERWTTRGAK